MENTDLKWRKSTFSGGANGSCVEVGTVSHSAVVVRDTTDRDGATLSFAAAAWASFIERQS